MRRLLFFAAWSAALFAMVVARSAAKAIFKAAIRRNRAAFIVNFFEQFSGSPIFNLNISIWFCRLALIRGAG